MIKINIKDGTPFRKIGFHLFLGMIHAFGLLLIFGFILAHFLPADDSDKSRFDRSGLTVHTDEKTSLQYLSKGDCLTPRLDEHGNQLKSY